MTNASTITSTPSATTVSVVLAAGKTRHRQARRGQQNQSAQATAAAVDC